MMSTQASVTTLVTIHPHHCHDDDDDEDDDNNDDDGDDDDNDDDVNPGEPPHLQPL